jgi:flavin-dependent dehydrogenase
LLGDAYAFVDPVFSSGVYLAMHSAFVGADVVAAELDHDARRAAAARKRFAAVMQQGPRDFSWFIYRMTNPALRGLFMHPRNLLRVQEAVLSLLAGDIFGRTPFRRSLNLFKGIYYIASLLQWRAGLKHWRMRRDIARQFGAIEGETVMKT